MKFTSEQMAAPLTQKLTVPLVTAVEPASTVAVSVRWAGDVIDPPEETAVPPLAAAMAVVVAVPEARACPEPRPSRTAAARMADVNRQFLRVTPAETRSIEGPDLSAFEKRKRSWKKRVDTA
jgi:hypothetical protein